MAKKNFSFTIGMQFTIEDLKDEMDQQFVNLYNRFYLNQNFNQEEFINKSLVFFNESKNNFEAHDSFFNNFTILTEHFLKIVGSESNNYLQALIALAGEAPLFADLLEAVTEKVYSACAAGSRLPCDPSLLEQILLEAQNCRELVPKPDTLARLKRNAEKEHTRFDNARRVMVGLVDEPRKQAKEAAARDDFKAAWELFP